MSQFFIGFAILLVMHALDAVAIVGIVYVSPVARPRCVNLRRAHHGVHVVELRPVRLYVHADEWEHATVQARTPG